MPESKKKLTSLDKKRLKHDQRRLEDKLDRMIGFHFWKTYIACSLWSNIKTPVNLTITICTALTSMHSAASNGSSFISDELNMKLNIATFITSIISTFFTPQKQYTDLNEILCAYTELGNSFEKVIYSGLSPDKKIDEYTKLLDKANDLIKIQSSKHRNFVTDLLHTIVRIVFMNSNDRWMKEGSIEFYEKIQDNRIELDFSLDELKRTRKRASCWERLCSCFYTRSMKEKQPTPQANTETPSEIEMTEQKNIANERETLDIHEFRRRHDRRRNETYNPSDSDDTFEEEEDNPLAEEEKNEERVANSV